MSFRIVYIPSFRRISDIHIVSMFVPFFFSTLLFALIHGSFAVNDKVNFTLYYETLCPDCREFVSTQLWRAYQTIPDIVNISFVPYGNAREIYRPETKLYQFYCQHGSDECYGNLIHVNSSFPSIDRNFLNLSFRFYRPA